MWTRVLLRTKLKALAMHLGLSALIFIPFLYLIWFHWFPPPLFFTDGGWQGVRIMLLVDMVLGPALTFLIFNPAKSRLALGIDFAFIGVAQAVALAYGAMSVEHNRLQAVAFMSDAFYAVPRPYFARQGVTAADLSGFGQGPQVWVYVRNPQPEEKARYVEATAVQGLPVEALYFLYEPLSAGKEAMTKRAVNVKKLGEVSAEFKVQYEEFVQAHGGDAAALSFYPLFGSYRNMLVAVNAEGRYVGYLGVDAARITR